jgi:hypothetical protein
MVDHAFPIPYTVARELHHPLDEDRDRVLVGTYMGTAASEYAAERCCHMHMQQMLEVALWGKAAQNRMMN